MKKTNYIFVTTFLLFAQLAFSQTTDSARVSILQTKCTDFITQENYQGLLTIAYPAYTSFLLNNNMAAGCLFSYYTGLGFEGTGKSDSALYFYRLSEEAGFQLRSPARFTAAQIRLAGVYYTLGKPDSVSVYLTKMLIEVDTLHNDSLQTDLYKEIANIYLAQNEYDKAISTYFHLLQYSEKQKNARGIGIAFVNIGNAYLQMSNSAKALPYLLKAMPYLAGYEYGQVICADNIGAAYTNLTMYDSAIVWHEKAITVAKRIKDTDDIYAASEKLSEALIGKKEYNEAERYVKPALQYALATSTATEIIDGEQFLGEIETGRKNYKMAFDYFSKALQYAQKTDHEERESELYMCLATTADSMHDYSVAAKYYSHYILLNDSLTKESSKRSIAEIETKYQTSQKEQQIKLLDQKSKTQALALRAQQNTTWFALAAFVLLAIIVVLYLRYRSRINQLKKLTDIRNGISRDLHDEIGATLSSINIYSEVAINKLREEPEIKRLLERIHDGSAQVMESMSDIVWYVNPTNDNAETLIIKMREYAAPVLEAKNIQLNFACADDIRHTKLMMQQRQHFYLLFKEAINNIAKYACAKHAAVDIHIASGCICLAIADDGKGFDMHNLKPGNGLINIEQRAKLLKGACVIKSAVDKGTSVEVKFPVSL